MRPSTRMCVFCLNTHGLLHGGSSNTLSIYMGDGEDSWLVGSRETGSQADG